MRWAQAGGGGPEGEPGRAGGSRPGFEVLVDASLPLGPAPGPDPSTLAAVRRALAAWEVTTIVVPDQPDLPVYAQGRSPAYAAGLFTAVDGPGPALRGLGLGVVGRRPAGTAPAGQPGRLRRLHGRARPPGPLAHGRSRLRPGRR